MTYIIATSMLVLFLLFLWFEERDLGIKNMGIYSILYIMGLTLVIINYPDHISMVTYLSIFLMLAISVVRDVKDRTVPIEYYIGLLSIIFVKAWLIPDEVFNKDMLINILTIVVLLVAGYLFRHSLGFGDILLFCIMTLILGYRLCIVLILLGMMLTSLTGLAMIAMRKVNRKSQLPFSPFILAGYMIYIMI